MKESTATLTLFYYVSRDCMIIIYPHQVDDTGTYTCIASAETPLYIERRKDVEIIVKGTVQYE